MRESDVAEVVHGTTDAAFAVTLDGVVRSCNSAAGQLFGIDSEAARGENCFALLRGSCASGPFCGEDCIVRQRARLGQSTPGFEMEVKAASGRRWVSVSVIVVPVQGTAQIIHLARDEQDRKRIEDITRDFLMRMSALSGVEVERLFFRQSSPHMNLTDQEKAVLRLLVEGKNTAMVSEALHVSRTTVRNHVEHVLQKLDTHSRVEAVLKAIREKLV